MLTGTVSACESVDARVVDRLYDLFVKYYRDVERRVFDQDWEEKDRVLLLRDTEGTIQGFTTMKLYDLDFVERRVRVVFNGNTIIDPSYWGEQELVRPWCRFMAELKMEAPSVPLYWYLISSGYRTYLFLPLFFREFVPRWDRSPPVFEAGLRDFLGRMKFPEEYRDGVVHVEKPRECLRPDLAVPSPARLKSRHVQFFLQQNPGYLNGDELVCLAEYSLDNTQRTARTALEEKVIEERVHEAASSGKSSIST